MHLGVRDRRGMLLHYRLDLEIAGPYRIGTAIAVVVNGAGLGLGTAYLPRQLAGFVFAGLGRLTVGARGAGRAHRRMRRAATDDRTARLAGTVD